MFNENERDNLKICWSIMCGFGLYDTGIVVIDVVWVVQFKLINISYEAF